MFELEDAGQRILAALPAPAAERVHLHAAAGRVLAENLVAPLPLPRFDNSSMDGYAVRAADTVAATGTAPVVLRLVGRVAAGESPAQEVGAGQCIRLFTGSPMPAGADAVVMQEDTHPCPEDSGSIQVCDSVQPGENVRRRGEDVAEGELLQTAGDRLNAAQAGRLAAVGLSEIKVARQPLVALLATGSELRELGQPLQAGQIYESNRAALAPLITRAGGLTKVFPLVPDNLPDTAAALKLAFSECDLVVTSGGVSVGELDFVKAALEQLGGQLQFWKVAIRPGKPFVFGSCGAKFLFGLPGNPVSAFVTFLLLVRPAILRWQGAKQVSLPQLAAMAGEDFRNGGDRPHFLRVRLDDEGKVFSAGHQASHALSSLAVSNGLLRLAPGASVQAGNRVTVLRWD